MIVDRMGIIIINYLHRRGFQVLVPLKRKQVKQNNLNHLRFSRAFE